MRTLYGAALSAVFGLAAVVTGQSPLMQPGFVAGGPAAVQDVAPATHYGGGRQDNAFVNAYGEPFVTPASYACGDAGCYGGGPACGGCYGGEYGYGCHGGGGACGGGGGGLCSGLFGGHGHGRLAALLAGLGNTEQCGPHYFDLSAEYLHYERDGSALGNLPITTIGFANENLNDLDSATRLSTSQLSSDALDGFRLTGRIDVGALSVFEVAYSGLWDEDSASFAAPDDSETARLFSVFSRFGTRTNGPAGSDPGRPVDSDSAPGSNNPLNDNPGGTNFQETDFASYHGIRYESELHNAEALFRRYWVGYNPRISGTILLGFRYTSLSERLGFTSIGSQQTGTSPDTFGADPALTINIDADADNQLAGFECGGDVWVTVLQGLRLGTEVKVGIYNNEYDFSGSAIAADGSPMGSATGFSGNQASFLTEAKLMMVADVTPSLSLKAGYEVLFISDVALLDGGLAQVQPYGDINDIAADLPGAGATTDGEVTYHGFHVGAEWTY
ncbi:hypothetical protein MalM25_08840 [Planctomycetes bacterium MalM25]|nr:hypothetical protein MalM25_08840 [Planctomycetes bacterium MalM25]